MSDMAQNPSAQAALRGEPSYVWRAGQEHRLAMIQQAAGERLKGFVFEDGCGVGAYLEHLSRDAHQAVGLEIEFVRAAEAHNKNSQIVNGAGEQLPFPNAFFDLILSHEVLEHVQDDRKSMEEIIRTLKPGGRLVLFVPNRGYPFETHGIFVRGKYRFGNKFLVNWLTRRWRDRLAPHVRAYSKNDIQKLLNVLPVSVVDRKIIFGAYDNIIARSPALGKTIRGILQVLEKTPLRIFGLSHFWVIEKI
jgi:SAM-dependent methyltransferase